MRRSSTKAPKKVRVSEGCVQGGGSDRFFQVPIPPPLTKESLRCVYVNVYVCRGSVPSKRIIRGGGVGATSSGMRMMRTDACDTTRVRGQTDIMVRDQHSARRIQTK